MFPPQSYPLKFAVSRPDFEAHLLARAEHHQQRAEYYAKETERHDNELKQQLERGESVTERIDIKNSSPYDNQSHLRTQARAQMQQHQTKAKTFAWYAEHLGDTMTFYLTPTETSVFEMTE